MFRLLGFDVQVRVGFVTFLGLIVLIHSDAFGFWLAGAIAVLTLLHELGHAVAARSAGAKAAIELGFMAGYTAFRPDPKRPMSRGQRALISAAGPLVQIGVSVVVLAVMGVNPLSFDDVRASEAAFAIWWAGPIIGAMNLIPVLPLDGGHLASVALEGLLGERTPRVMAVGSIALTAAAAIAMAATGHSEFAIFVVFLLIGQLQLLQATGRRRHSAPVNPAVAAERAAWETGRPTILEPGQRLSPWFEAHRLLKIGDTDGAVAAIVRDLGDPKVGRWAPPAAANRSQLAEVVAVLPDDLPLGNEYSARVLTDVLLSTGNPAKAGRFAVAHHGEQRSSLMALAVARSAAQLGEFRTSLQWLIETESASLDEPVGYRQFVRTVIDAAPEFEALRNNADFQALRTQLAT